MTHALLRLQESRVKQEQQQLSACDTATAEAEAQMHRNTSGGDVGDWIGMDTGLSMRQSVKLVRQGGGPVHMSCTVRFCCLGTRHAHAHIDTQARNSCTHTQARNTRTHTQEWSTRTRTQAQNGARIHKHRMVHAYTSMIHAQGRGGGRARSV